MYPPLSPHQHDMFFLLWLADLLGPGHGVRGAARHTSDAHPGLALAAGSLHRPAFDFRLPLLCEKSRNASNYETGNIKIPLL